MLNNEAIKVQLLEIFRQEQAEHVEAVRALLTASASPRRPLTQEERDEVFRRFHSLKGAARAVDIATVEQMTHQTETLLGRLRINALNLPPEIVAHVLHLSLDAVEALVAAETAPEMAGEANAAAQQAQAALAVAARGDESTPTPASPVVSAPPVPAPVPISAPPLPVASGTISLEVTPTVAPAETATPPTAAPTTSVAETVRVRVDLLDRLVSDAQLLQQTVGEESVTTALADLGKQLDRLADLLPAGVVSGKEGEAQALLGTVRRDTRRLRRHLQDRVWDLRRLGVRLTEETQSARLVEAETATEGFGRMVRTLARDSGKEAEFSLTGGNSLIDRQVAHALRDPLRHLLRNTISHGIEAPETREASGKSRVGQVSVHFQMRGTRLEVEIEDDGRGLDKSAVLRTALTSGLITPDDAERMGEEQAARLIFEPGFSTARDADSLSGRGMGLSVVAQTVARLGGDIRVLSRSGGGMRIRLALPQSLATSRLLYVEAGGQLWGLPTFLIEGLHRLPADWIERVEGRSVVRLKGAETTPVADLAALLDLPSMMETTNSAVCLLVVLVLAGERWALRVDRLRDEEEALVRPLGPYLKSVRTCSGTVLRSDGSIALALLPGELAARVRGRARRGTAMLAPVAVMPEPSKRRRQSRILVVDDSITTRTLEQSILETHGYQVRVAVDGRDALAKVREGLRVPDQSVDLIVSDVEMPYMNGFDLLQAVREDADLAQLPFILVTSLGSFEDRERGLSLGADAYIIKSKFDQQELLETVEQLLLQV